MGFLGTHLSTNRFSLTVPLLGCFTWFAIMYPVVYVYGNLWNVSFALQLSLIVLQILLQEKMSALENVTLIVLSVIGQMKVATLVTNILQIIILFSIK